VVRDFYFETDDVDWVPLNSQSFGQQKQAALCLVTYIIFRTNDMFITITKERE
jgi:hypothetical protein